MALNGVPLASGTVYMCPRASKPLPYNPTLLPLSVRSSKSLNQGLKCSSSKGISALHLSAASDLLLRGERVRFSRAFPGNPKRKKCDSSVMASKDVPYLSPYPPMTEKPRWWWRSLACLPYLMPIYATLVYAETAYHLHPVLEDFEYLTEPLLLAFGSLPSFFLMAQSTALYLGNVRRKEWPHFFRFHVVMGMLLENAVQVMGTVSGWLPLSIYKGKFPMHFWTAMVVAQLFTVFECVRCALAGMYPEVPFISDSAYIHSSL